MQPKFFVVRLGQIIKVALALVCAVTLVMVAIHFIGGDKATYSPGTYRASIVLEGKPMDVAVTVNRHSIENVALENISDSQEVFYPTFNSCIGEVSKSVIEYQSADIPLSEEYPVSESIILQAVNNALEKAKK